MIEGSCPIHDDLGITVDCSGRVGCSFCADMRKAARNRRLKNARFDRHSRETMIRVPNAALRERFETLESRGAITASEVALAAGYTMTRGRGRPDPDVQQLKRRLGILPQSSRVAGDGGGRVQGYADQVDYDTAVKLCYAMGVDYPAEVGV